MKISFRMTIAILVISFLLPVIAICQSQKKDDRQLIIDHIHSIFKAYVQQDREAIRVKHTEDWMGFKAASREIVRGIDGYMQNLSLANVKMLEYEIQEIEVQIYGDIAVVYYVAQWQNRINATGQIVRIRARSVDIYRKDASGWNQCGSNLNILPAPNFWATPGCDQCYDISFSTDGK